MTVKVFEDFAVDLESVVCVESHPNGGGACHWTCDDLLLTTEISDDAVDALLDFFSEEQDDDQDDDLDWLDDANLDDTDLDDESDALDAVGATAAAMVDDESEAVTGEPDMAPAAADPSPLVDEASPIDPVAAIQAASALADADKTPSTVTSDGLPVAQVPDGARA